MCDRVRASRVIHTDDTGIKMLAPGSCRNAKFWTDIGDAAILLSVIASAKHCGVEPWSWLTAVLKELALRLANSRGQLTRPTRRPDGSIAGRLAPIAPATSLANRRTAPARKNPLPPSKAQQEKTVTAMLTVRLTVRLPSRIERFVNLLCE